QLVYGGREGEIAELTGPSQVRHTRQQRALDHRTQEYIGREPGRLLSGNGPKLLKIVPLPASAGHETIAVGDQPVAAKLALQHHQGSAVSHRHARGSSGGSQLLRPPIERLIDLRCPLQGTLEDRGRRAFGSRMGAVEAY